MLDLTKVSKAGWKVIIRWSVLGTIACISFANLFNWFTFKALGEEALMRGLFSATVIPVFLATPAFAFLSLKLIELSATNKKLNKLAQTDSMTGLLNRRAFVETINDYLNYHRHNNTLPCDGMMMILDVDHFKTINDNYGHLTGDAVLTAISDRLQLNFPQDVVARVGGEEFAIMVGRCGAETMDEIAERTRRSIEDMVLGFNDHPPLSATVSIGYVAINPNVEFETHYKLADAALYEAKNAGRNCTHGADFLPLLRPFVNKASLSKAG